MSYTGKTFEQAAAEAQVIAERESYTVVGLRWEFEKYIPRWVVIFLVSTDLRTVEMTL